MNRPAVWLFRLILSVFVGLGLTYALVTPCFESSDEWSHLSVIRYRAGHGRLPPRVLAPRSEVASEEWYFAYHDPPLYYAPPLYHSLAALLVSWSEMEDLPTLLVPSPNWARGWPPQAGSDPRDKSIYAHRAEETLAGSGTVRAAALLRIVSLLLGAVGVWCAWRIARALWPDRPPVAAGAAACVALNPQFIALAIGVTNDNLLNALFGLTLLCYLRSFEGNWDWGRWGGVGVLVGLGLLTKQSAFLLLPLGWLAIVWRPMRRGWLKNALAFTGAALAVGGWWYWHNWRLYGDPLGLESHFVAQRSLAGFGLAELGAAARSYWAAFGWAPLLLPAWVYGLAGAAALAALAGFATAARPRGALWRLSAPTRRGVALLALAFLLNAASFVRWAVATGSPSGRLLFPTLPAVAGLAAWGMAQWTRPRWARAGVVALVVLAFLIAAIIPWAYLRPAYASPRLSGGLPETARSVELAFQGGIRLIGYEPLPRELRPGREMRFTIYWRAAAQPLPRCRVWAQLGPQDATQRVAEDNDWLGSALYPSDLWQLGDTVRQTFRFVIPEWAPAPELYWVRIGLWAEDATGAEMKVPVAGAPANDMVVLGPWRMTPAALPPPPAVPADFRLEPVARLRGYDMTWEDRGRLLRLTLHWEAEAAAADYVVFVHLLGADGQLLGQADGPPRGGGYPTSWWQPGDIVVDPREIHLDEAAALRGDRRMALRIGMYDPATMLRLPAYDGAGHRLPDDAIVAEIQGLSE